MPETKPESTADWVARWRRLGPELEQERLAALARTTHAEIIASFDRAYRASLRSHPPSCDSGLIEQQRLFRRQHHA